MANLTLLDKVKRILNLPEYTPSQLQMHQKVKRLVNTGIQNVKQSKLRDYFLPTSTAPEARAGRQFVKETGKNLIDTARQAYKLIPPYTSYQNLQRKTVTPLEYGRNTLNTGLNALSIAYRVSPTSKIMGPAFGMIRQERQNPSVVNRQYNLKQNLYNIYKGGLTGLTEQPGLGETLTDNPRLQKAIDYTFMATMIAKPFVQKKLNQLNLKAKEINKVSNILGVKPNTPLNEVAKVWRKEVSQYPSVFANKGNELANARVRELNSAFTVLKNAGVIDKNYATVYKFFETVNPNFGLSVKPTNKGNKRLGNINTTETAITTIEPKRKFNIPLRSTKPPIPKRSELSGRALSMSNDRLLYPEKYTYKEDLGLARQEWLENKPTYTKSYPKTNIRKPEAFVKEIRNEFEDTMGRFNKITPKEKVNIIDYLRTPDRVLKKIGLEKESNQIRKSWDNYLDELPKEIEKVTNWSKRVPDASSNRIIFKYLDGQINSKALNKEELEVATEIKKYLKDWAVRLELPEEKRITSYITHIWEKDVKGTEFPPEIAAIIRDKVAGSVYDPFVTQRLGVKGYVEDTWRALDAYVKRATRKVNMDEALSTIKRASEGMEDSQFKYVKKYVDNINLRPSDIDNTVDNAIKSIPAIGYRLTGRPTAYVTRKARRMTYRGLLGLNAQSALKNLSQASNTYAELKEKYFVTGYAKMILDLPRYILNKPTELDRVGVLRDNFIQDRQLTATKKAMEKMDKGLYYMFELAEKINRGGAYYGGKARALNNGKTLSEATAEGKEVARKTQFTFGAVDTPVALQSDIAKTFTQFMSYSIKQGEFLTEKAFKKEYGGLIRYVGSMLLFIYTIGKSFGMDWKDLIPTVRIGFPPTMQLPKGIYDVVTGAKDKWGNEPEPNMVKRLFENKDIQRGIVNYIPAGGQARKTYGGIKNYVKGESTTKTGLIRFPIEKSKSNLIKSGLFGQYSIPEAREYYNKKRTQLGKKQTKLVREAKDKLKVYQEIMANREIAKQENKVKDIVRTAGSSSYYGDKYFYLDKVSGDVKTIDTAFRPTKPKMTGNYELDKKLRSNFYRECSKRVNYIVDSYEQGLIDKDEAEKQLKEVARLKASVKGSRAKSAKKITIKKIPFINAKTTIKRTPKAKITGFKIAKPPTIKPMKTRNILIK